MKKYKAVIFDLDGTLIDSMWVWEHVNNTYFEMHQLENPKDMDTALEGKSFTETAQYFKTRFNLTQEIEEIKDSWNQIAWDFYTQKVTLKDGARAFLNQLKENQIKVGIATSNSQTLVKAVLEYLDITEYFDSIRTSCEVEKGKPFPYIYLKVAQDLGVAPEECLVFEDVPNGVRAGKSAGMDVWAIEDRQTQYMKDELNKLADKYVINYTEVMTYFD